MSLGNEDTLRMSCFGKRAGPSEVSRTINLDLYHGPVQNATRNQNSFTSVTVFFLWIYPKIRSELSTYNFVISYNTLWNIGETQEFSDY